MFICLIYNQLISYIHYYNNMSMYTTFEYYYNITYIHIITLLLLSLSPGSSLWELSLLLLLLSLQLTCLASATIIGITIITIIGITIVTTIFDNMFDI